MSIDLLVVGSKALTPEQLERAVPDGDLLGLFGGPLEVGVEDVPEEVAGEAGDATWVAYETSVVEPGLAVPR
ncbi:MAG: hypothetical protein LBR27_09250 [Bifidobacteriaceae bacterium]|nr:hypothetical protein [Bifidobacteriaceae bacterium]